MLKTYFSKNTWSFKKTLKKFIGNFFKVLGVLWLPISIVNFYSKEGILKSWIGESWVYLIIISVLFSFILSFPRLKRVIQTENNTVKIIIKVGNIFKQKGYSLIIPINDNLEYETVSLNSVHVQYAKSLKNKGIDYDKALKSSIKKNNIESIGTELKTKYSLGTVIEMENLNNKFSKVFLVVTARLNSKKIAIPEGEDLKHSLNKLWLYLVHNGKKDKLVMPIMGSGNNKLIDSREELIYQVIETFWKNFYTHENKITEEILIVINPSSFERNKISLDEVANGIQHICIRQHHKHYRR